MAVLLKEKILEILRAQKGFDEKRFERAVKLQGQKGGSLSRILVESGAITQKDLMLVLSRQLNIPPINLSRYTLDPSVMELIPERIIRDHNVIPISRIGNTLTVAVSDPLDLFLLDRLKAVTDHRVEIVLSTENDIRAAIGNFYSGRGFDINKTIRDMDESGVGIVEALSEEKIDIGEIRDSVKLPVIVKIVNVVIIEAMRRRASDIHIEPAENHLKIRYRTDGVLHEAFSLPKKSQNAIIARIKILSKLDITSANLPQDGRFKIKIRDKEIDFRVSVLPTSFGNKVVLRILDKTSLGIGLDKLGFLSESVGIFKKALEKPYGMILVTGPTGSGKSTTLYSILNEMNTPERSIITLEDPVEYQIEGITQIQARPEIGLTFASGLRSVLRQNPDIIMIGEIRDFETADIAIKASLTGQLVFSTLHTNDAASAITRLIDMGVEPFLIASSLIFICAQRLIRRICPNCKGPYQISKDELERLSGDYDFAMKIDRHTFYKGKGCPKCDSTGFFGRQGILEALLIDDNIRGMIAKKSTSDEIKAYVVKRGMRTLRQEAFEKFVDGSTALEETLSVTSED
ncbi:MAG: Flp pilus assembly complex ATPase component TadA [Candidatus Omnitrophica bacterium]|nr:Flp pilus assembly complex ATPase component TadA [Candidatus Omnitrophota bacterium]